MNIAIFASGNGSNFENIVREQREAEDSSLGDVKLLVVDQVDAYVIKRAKQLDIPYVVFDIALFKTKQAYEKAVAIMLTAYEIDLIVLAGYMRLIGSDLLTAYPQRILNIHPAYLPAFPGKQGVKDAFDAQVSETGVTVHIVDEGMDSGPILDQKKVNILPTDTLETLETRIHQVERELYPQVIRAYIQKIKE